MENIIIDKTKTIAFTGHRNIEVHKIDSLKEDLANTLLEQYAKGYHSFIVGGAKGFDLLSAEAVLNLKETFADVQLFIAVPYAGHHDYFTEENKKRYVAIAECATSNIILSSRYYDGCFLYRNDYMLENSSLLIAYYGQSFQSGTGYTVRKGEANNIPVINLFK